MVVRHHDARNPVLAAQQTHHTNVGHPSGADIAPTTT
jgi:hypothetical protein